MTPITLFQRSAAFIQSVVVPSSKFVRDFGMTMLYPSMNNPYAHQVNDLSPLKGRVGPKLTQVAADMNSKLHRALENGFVTEGLIDGVVNPEELFLHLFDNASDSISRITLNDLGNNLSIFTKFLTRYRETFAALSSKKFETREAEVAAWKERMGDAWHPVLDSYKEDASTRRVTFAKHFEKNLQALVAEALFKKPFEFRGTPGFQAGLQKVVNKRIAAKFDAALETPEGDTKIKKIVRFATNLAADRFQQLENFRSVLQGFYDSLPLVANRPQAIELPSDVLVLVNIDGEERVYDCSEQSTIAGITPGMPASTALQIWNVNFGNDPKFVREGEPLFTAYIQNKPTLKELVTMIVEVLLELPAHLALKKASGIPKVGYLAAQMLSPIFFLTKLTFSGLNLFVGLPSKKVLANEIAENLVKYLDNPALLAAPFLVIDRLIETLQGKKLSNVIAKEDAPFIGDLIVESMKTVATLCPSLFTWRFPRLVKAAGQVAFWAVRKVVAITGLALVNPVTRAIANLGMRYFSNSITTLKMQFINQGLHWIQSSCLTLLGTKNNLAAAHSILSSGYKKMGDLELVTSEQSHFENAGRSLPHLIHHTVLAALRFNNSKEAAMNHLDRLTRCEMILSHIDSIAPDAEEIAFLIEFNEQERARLIDAAQFYGRIKRDFRLKPDRLKKDFFPSEFSIRIDVKIAHDYLEVLAKQLKAKVSADQRQYDETSPVYINFLNQIEDVRRELDSILLLPAANSLSQAETDIVGRKVTYAYFRHDQLMRSVDAFFTQAERLVNRELREIQLIWDGQVNVAALKSCIGSYLYKSTIELSSNERIQRERELVSELKKREEMQTQLDTAREQLVAQYQNTPELFAMLTKARQRLNFGVRRDDAWSTMLSRTVNWAYAGQCAESSQVTFEEIAFHFPRVVEKLQYQQNGLLLQAHLITADMRELSKNTALRPLYSDPVWMLQAKGADLVTIGKRVLPPSLLGDIVESALS